MNRRAAHASVLALAFAASAAVLAPAPVQATGEWPPVLQRYCEQAFDTAQRIDMESFRDYDAQAFRDIHTEDAVTVFGSGAYRVGIDAIMAALAGHFANREAVWEWTELHREVKGCDTAFIIYDTTYSIPSIGYSARARTGVTYTFERGRWLAVFDQSTPLPPAP